MRWPILLVPIVALRVFADDLTPVSVAKLVHQTDESALTAPLTAALRSPAPLVRATAARIVAVKAITALLPIVREAMAAETDGTAAREEIRALTLLGDAEDIALAVKTTAQWPEGMDNALAIAAARRGVTPAMDTYAASLRNTRMKNHSEFFRTALWGHPEAAAFVGSRMLSLADESGWRGILAALSDSGMTMSSGVLASSLGSASEDIRSASTWSLIQKYAPDPAAIGDVVKNALAEPRSELSSNREDFGREILRRMLGGEKKDDPRWLKFLQSEEADSLFQGNDHALQYLTDDEYTVRYNRCEIQSKECAMPPKRGRFTIPSQPVTPPAFNLPEVLPAGLADAILSEAKCRGQWLGVANATVDPSGRVAGGDLTKVSASGSCKRAIETVLRLSMATNTSLRSGFAGPVLLVGTAKSRLCLDEDSPEETSQTYRAGGEITPPQVLKRVEPQFAESARRAMAGGYSVLVMTESVIAKAGCVRNIRLLSQAPFGEGGGAGALTMEIPARLSRQETGRRPLQSDGEFHGLHKTMRPPALQQAASGTTREIKRG